MDFPLTARVQQSQWDRLSGIEWGIVILTGLFVVGLLYFVVILFLSTSPVTIFATLAALIVIGVIAAYFPLLYWLGYVIFFLIIPLINWIGGRNNKTRILATVSVRQVRIEPRCIYCHQFTDRVQYFEINETDDNNVKTSRSLPFPTHSDCHWKSERRDEKNNQLGAIAAIVMLVTVIVMVVFFLATKNSGMAAGLKTELTVLIVLGILVAMEAMGFFFYQGATSQRKVTRYCEKHMA